LRTVVEYAVEKGRGEDAAALLAHHAEEQPTEKCPQGLWIQARVQGIGRYMQLREAPAGEQGQHANGQQQERGIAGILPSIG
jgi:hypothetical protein